MMSKYSHYIIHFTGKDNNKIEPDQISTLTGQTVYFKCLSHVQTTWYFNDGPLPLNAEIFQNISYGYNYLKVTSVKLNNTGLYMCEGRDLDTNIYFTAEAMLDVRGTFCSVLFWSGLVYFLSIIWLCCINSFYVMLFHVVTAHVASCIIFLNT